MQSSRPRRTLLRQQSTRTLPRQQSTRGFSLKCRPQECRPLEYRPLKCPPQECHPTPTLVNTTISHRRRRRRRSLQLHLQLVRPLLHLSQSPRTPRLPPSPAWGVADLTLFAPPNILGVRTGCSNFAFLLNSV